jgi:hypothetical protein
MILFGRKINRELILYASIILLALLLRFVRYDQRWGLAYDQARDAIIGREVLTGKSIPLIGPFSSAGNFTTGPVWYWFVIAATAVFPFAVITPWVVMTLTYILMVYVLIRIGRAIGGNTLGVILGLFAAVSPAEISQGFNLTNPSLVAVCTTIAVLAGIEYLGNGKTLMLAVLVLPPVVR